jgi:hypothetical protein
MRLPLILACFAGTLLWQSVSTAAITSSELYEACQLFQASSSNEAMAQKLTLTDSFRAGRCVGYAESFPYAYMIGRAAPKQVGAAPGKLVPPRCYQPGKTKVGEVVSAIVRRYEKTPNELKNEPGELLMLLALQDELPCN